MASATKLTEEQIDAAVESATDTIERRYMRGDITLDEYDAAIANLYAWSIAQEGGAA